MHPEQPELIPCEVQITPRGWWVVTYPHNSAALLLFTNPVEKHEFLSSNGVQSIADLTSTNRDWYIKSKTFPTCPF